MDSPYTSDYFLNGKATGKSNYEGYRWLPDATLPFARHLQWFLHLDGQDVILDHGCARGYLVKALRLNGLNARGMDISEWAIENCDPSVKEHVSNDLVTGDKIYDWVIAKDCWEHIELNDLKTLVPKFGHSVRKGIFIVVPLTAYTSGPYVRAEDEQDPTHKIRFTLPDWLLFLTDLLPEFNVCGSYHIHGIKPASVEKRQSCGFFTMTRH
jgi:cyclopropane fatty-acyl-phospholipid synthase-like methyltransferase